MDLGNKTVIDILHKEYERVASHIRLLEATNDKIVGFGISIIVAGFAYGIQYKIAEIFFFLPVALIGVFLYATLQYYNLFWLGGYACAVEELINELAGHTLLYWETLIQSQRPRTNLNNIGLVLLYLGIFVAITLYSVDHVFALYDRWLAWVDAGVVFSFTSLLFFAVRNMMGAYRQSYEASTQALRLAVEPAKSAE
jgi:hypothetical protein